MILSTTDNIVPGDPWARGPRLHDLTRHDIWGLRRGFIERLWPQVRGWRVLEAGSGPAHDSLTFAQRGADVTALDCSQAGLSLARQIYRGLRLPIRTVLASADGMPFCDSQFDLAFNGGVLEHFTDLQLESVIDEMARVVRPGGHLLAFCPNRYNIFYQVNLKRARRHAYEFERAFTASEIRRRFRARGLVDIRVSGVHVHPAPNYLLPQWFPKVHRIESWCARCCRSLEQANRWHRLKSLIGQDFVVWARVPGAVKPRQTIAGFTGGPAVLSPTRKAA